MLSLALALLTAIGSAFGGPPSSPTSPAQPHADYVAPSRFVTTTFKCNGYYRSHSCVNTVYFNNCKNSIKMEWLPLKLPGNLEWARTRRNWCSITWVAEGSVEERKYRPEQCEQILKVLAAGLQGFPEVKWQDAQCTHIGTPDGIIYTTQHWERPVPQEHFTAPLPDQDPEPRAARLEDVNSCVLKNDKTRVLKCPVLPQLVQSWLRKFLATVKVSLIIQNPVR